MNEVVMTLTEAIEALAEEGYLVFEDEYEVEAYMTQQGWHYDYDCEWPEHAIDASDPEHALEELADALDVNLVGTRDIEYAHDTGGHTGAIAYCTRGACAVVNNY